MKVLLRTGIRRALIILASTLALVAYGRDTQMPGIYAEFSTTKGRFVAVLDEVGAPLAVANFVGLSEGTKFYSKNQGETPHAQSKPFYDGVRFHRSEGPFMIATGAARADGSGGPGYDIPIERNSRLAHNTPGILSMSPGSNGRAGSQFLVTRMAMPWLDKKNTAFGKVVEGIGTALSLTSKDKVLSIKVLRRGPVAQAFKGDEEHFNVLLRSRGEKP